MTKVHSLHKIFTVTFSTLFICATVQGMDPKTGESPVNCLYYFRIADNNEILATPLDQAACYNRLDVLKLLLDNKADPNLINQPTGLPPLTTAINQGSIGAAHELLKAGASSNAPDAHGGSPLIAAAEKGYAPLVARLLQLRADVKKKTYARAKHVTALMQSAQNGHLPVVDLLITAKATLNTPDAHGSTALHKAVLNEHNDVVKRLLVAGASPHKRDADGKRPLDYASTEEMRELLHNTKPSTNTNVHDNRPVGYVVTKNMRNFLQELISGAPKDIEQLNKYLIIAAQEGNPGVLSSFLSQGADVNAIFTQQMDAQIKQTTAVCQAIQYNKLQGLSFLLKSGANPNLAKPNSGITPLFVAAFEGNTQAAILLLDAKADPNIPNVDEVTPLMVASAGGHRNLLKKLLFAKAHVNDSAKNAFGITALGQAAQQGLNQILAILIKAGADVDKTRTDGTTPLHDAVRNGHIKTVPLLLAADAKKDALDDEGKLPVDYAKTDAMKALLARGTTGDKKQPVHKKTAINKKRRLRKNSL